MKCVLVYEAGFGCTWCERKDKWGIPDKWINIQYHRWLTTDTYTLPSQQPTQNMRIKSKTMRIKSKSSIRTRIIFCQLKNKEQDEVF